MLAEFTFRSCSWLLGKPSHTVCLFPRTSSTETKTNPSGPRPALKQENWEDNTERETERRADKHRRDGTVPLWGEHVSRLCFESGMCSRPQWVVDLYSDRPAFKGRDMFGVLWSCRWFLAAFMPYLFVQKGLANGLGWPLDRHNRLGFAGVGHCDNNPRDRRCC